MTLHDRAIVLGPGEGKTVSVLGDRYIFKAVGEQTGGAFGLVEAAVAAGSAGPPPHIHGDEDEAFYVLEGEVSVLIGDQTMTAKAGSFAFVREACCTRSRTRGRDPRRS